MNKDWNGNSQSVWSVLAANNHSNCIREKNDYYATDPNALRIFLNKLNKDGIKLHNYIWECACGEGHLSKVLKENGYNVFSSDLINRGYGMQMNFLNVDLTGCKNDILTNPPYKYAKEFVEKALSIVADDYYVIMFLKIQFLEGKSRRSIFNQKNLKYVYVNTERQKCAMNGDFTTIQSSASCYCWFIWQKGYTGEPIIRWL